MKKSIFTLLLATFYLLVQGQSITVNDAPGSCYAALSFSPNGTVMSKNAYSNGSNTLEWNGAQWEIFNGSVVTHTNSTDLGLNPPCNGWTLTAAGEVACGTLSSSIKLTGASCTLPVELTSFTVNIKGKMVTLDWVTASELNNEGFDVQHSLNGTDWKSLDFVEGTGTTFEETRYSYEHQASNGTNFYRLIQEDFDGTISYSDIVSIKVSAPTAANVLVVPNFVVNNFRVTADESTAIYDIQIFDVNGRLVQQLFNVADNQTINVQDLTKGLYFVRIQNDLDYITHRILKQ